MARKIVKLNFVKSEDYRGRPLLAVEAVDARSREVEKSGSIAEVGEWLSKSGFHYVTGSQAAWLQGAA